jgi:hypothetical protein
MRDRLSPRLRLRPAVAIAAWATILALPPTAGAVVSDVRPIDGPSADVVDVADAAMSEDGSGGVVYLKREGGRSHVFAIQFRDGGWGLPRRVDVGQEFDSSWPRIGAGDGGRLVVTWVHEFGIESDRMFSATLDPGATAFQPPVPIDLNVGEATSTFPDLAMSRGGQAYLVYRVVTDTTPANPTGYIGADLRVARYGGRLWSVVGTPVDRNIATPVRVPTEENAPEVGIDIQGQGVVAWQEPDNEFVDRVWARRLFGSTFGIPLQVSPSIWDGLPLRGPADALSLDVAGFGQAAVAVRQHPGQAGALNAPRVFINEMPDVFSESAGAFLGPRLADGEIRGGLGPPGVAVDPRGRYIAALGSGAATLLSSGDDASVTKVERLDEGGSSVGGDPLADLAETGAAAVAWRELRAGSGVAAIQERRADGVNEQSALSAPRGGAVGRLVIGGSSLGDAIVAWRQGEGANAQIAAAVVNAPPDPFLILLPSGWQRMRRIPIRWDRTLNAIGGVRYSVSVDDEPVLENLRRLHAKLSPDHVGGGRHKVQIFAIDTAGQETGSRTGRLLVDRSAPRVRIRRRSGRLTVLVVDRGSGLRRGSVRVSFGDGTRATASLIRPKRKKRSRISKALASHSFDRAGRYAVVVRARDRARNRTEMRKTVRIR